MKILGNVKSNSLVDGRRSCPSGPPGLRPRVGEVESRRRRQDPRLRKPRVEREGSESRKSRVGRDKVYSFI